MKIFYYLGKAKHDIKGGLFAMKHCYKRAAAGEDPKKVILEVCLEWHDKSVAEGKEIYLPKGHIEGRKKVVRMLEDLNRIY